MLRRQLSERKLVALISALCLAFALCRQSLGYIDPGTTQVVWTSLAPIIGILVTCLLAAIWPLRIAWRFASARWKGWTRLGKAALLLGCVGLLVLAVLGIGRAFSEKDSPPVPTAPPPKADFKGAIVLGIDGLDPRILKQMMDAGELPNFSRLSKRGVFAPLQTSNPAQSPVAWTCAATGVNPGRHGLFDFVGRNPKDYGLENMMLRLKEKSLMASPEQPFRRSTDRPAFWDILSEHGVRVSVIRWPVTFPPHSVNGRLLSGLGTPDVAGTTDSFAFYTTRPPRAEMGPGADCVKVVSWKGDVVDAELPGPLTSSARGAQPCSVPLRIERSSDRASARVTIGKAEPVTLRPREWSGWIRFRFPIGLATSCPASVKIYLNRLEPELGLYVGGCQVDPADPAFPITAPPSFAGELAEKIGPYHTLSMPEECMGASLGVIPPPAFVEKCNEVTDERERMLDYELARFDGGLLAIVFDTNDRISHLFWPATDPAHPAHAQYMKAGFGPVIPIHYRRMDAVLGKVLDAAGERVAVIVMSDHGFAGNKCLVNVNTWLAQNGYLTAAAPLEKGSVGEKIPADWSHTKAYAAGFTSVYLNVRGREAQGIVSPGEEYRKVREELMRKLKAWIDPRTGEPILRNVYAGEDIYQGPYLDQAPDIVLGYYPGYTTSTASAAGQIPPGDVLISAERWPGDHMVDPPCVPGVFLSSFKINTEHPRLIDICPTVLRCFNVPAPRDTDGQSLY